MKGFRRRDYLIATLIISGVMSIWFLAFAAMFGVIPADVGLVLIVVLGFSLYWFFYRRPSKRKNGKS